MEVDDNARSCTQVTNHQRVNGGTKRAFLVEIEIIKEQLPEVEVNLARLKSEIGIFKAKKQKLGQHLGKNLLRAKKNPEQPKKP